MIEKKRYFRHILTRLVLAAGVTASVHGHAQATVNDWPSARSYTFRAPSFLGGIALEGSIRFETGKLAAPTEFRAFDPEAIAPHLSSPIIPPARPELDPIHTAAIVPGVFGSVAIPMHNFPVSTRWKPIYHAMEACSKGGCSLANERFSEILRPVKGKGFREKLSRVNRGINGLLTYKRDKATYGRMDYWAKPGETLKRNAGDCEDFAILKMAALLELGVPAKSMSLVVLQDQSMGVFHAVLAVSTGSGTFILDNIRNTVVKDSGLPSYVPLYSFSTDRAWIHGSKTGSSQKVAFKGGLAAIAPGEGSIQLEPDRAGTN